MNEIICPLDGRPCAPSCPDRYIDQPEGGCLLTTLAEISDAVIVGKGGAFHALPHLPPLRGQP